MDTDNLLSVTHSGVAHLSRWFERQWPPEFFLPNCPCCASCIPATGTLWCGATDDKLYLTSGIFSSTLRTSQDPPGVQTGINGISFSGCDVPWQDTFTDKWYLQSGVFTSTIKTSQATGNAADNGVGWDGTNTPYGRGTKLMLQSGQFSSIIKTSQTTSTISGLISVSWDGVDTPCSATKNAGVDDWLMLYSGQFTSTIKTSQLLTTAESTFAAGGCCDHAPDTLWCAQTYGATPPHGRLFLQSGQFTSTIKTSQDVSSIDQSRDIAHTDNAFG